jgi:hypothetical protein
MFTKERGARSRPPPPPGEERRLGGAGDGDRPRLAERREEAVELRLAELLAVRISPAQPRATARPSIGIVSSQEQTKVMRPPWPVLVLMSRPEKPEV